MAKPSPAPLAPALASLAAQACADLPGRRSTRRTPVSSHIYLSFKKTKDRGIRGWSSFLLFFICCQGLFGYLTVSLKLLPIIVTAHLFGGFTTLTLFYFIYLKSKDFQLFNQIKISNLRLIAGVAFVALIFQIFLGVWTSTNYASLACADFPTCQGSYYPEMDFESGFNLKQEVGPNYL